MLIFGIVFVSGCISDEKEEFKFNISYKDEQTNQTIKTEEAKQETNSYQKQNIQHKIETASAIQRAEPYINKIAFDDINIRKKAVSIVSECPSGDKECHINKLYRYVVENYKYYSDPRDKELIQSPYETMDIKGGDCEDLTILLISLSENIGIKTYLVLTEKHAYSLACGVDTENLWQYIKEDIITQVSKDLKQKENMNIVIKDGNLFVVSQRQETFVLKEGESYYYGGDGSKFDSSRYMNIEYSISSSKPITIYVVPSKRDFELMSKDKEFRHYPSCYKENVLKISDSCDRLKSYGGIILKNENQDIFSNKDATINLEIKFYFYYPLYKFIKDQKITYYEIENQKCIVLDATAGRYGYPGYDANLKGEKLAIDPITKKYAYLE